MVYILILNVRIRKSGIPSVLLEWYPVFNILTIQEIICSLWSVAA